MNIHEIIKTVSLSAAEKQVIANCDKKLKLLTDLEAETRCPAEANYHGKPSKLWDQICSTAEKFTTDPTLENFKAHTEVVKEIEFLERNKTSLTDLGNRAAAAARATLGGVVEGVVSRSLVELDKQAKERRAPAEQSGMGAEFEMHVDNLRRALESERGNGSPGGWLGDHGFLD